MMSPKNQHSLILLAKNESGAIVFCEGCDVVELEIGAVSMRIDAESLKALHLLLADADTRLNYFRLQKASFDQSQSADLSFH